MNFYYFWDKIYTTKVSICQAFFFINSPIFSYCDIIKNDLEWILNIIRWQAIIFNIFYRSKFMAFKVTDQCVNCGACEADCPVGAISENGDARVIDAGKCISCGTCAADCPAGAIVEE